MKEKIDKKLCKYCDFGDKDNIDKSDAIPCLNKMMGGKCKFE